MWRRFNSFPMLYVFGPENGTWIAWAYWLGPNPFRIPKGKRITNSFLFFGNGKHVTKGQLWCLIMEVLQVEWRCMKYMKCSLMCGLEACQNNLSIGYVSRKIWAHQLVPLQRCMWSFKFFLSVGCILLRTGFCHFGRRAYRWDKGTRSIWNVLENVG